MTIFVQLLGGSRDYDGEVSPFTYTPIVSK